MCHALRTTDRLSAAGQQQGRNSITNRASKFLKEKSILTLAAFIWATRLIPGVEGLYGDQRKYRFPGISVVAGYSKGTHMYSIER